MHLTDLSLGAEIHGESGLALRNGSLPPTNLQPIPGKAVLVMYERMWTHRQQRWGSLAKETVGLRSALVKRFAAIYVKRGNRIPACGLMPGWLDAGKAID